MEGNGGTAGSLGFRLKPVKLGALPGRFRVSKRCQRRLAPVTSGVGTAMAPAWHCFILRTGAGDKEQIT